MITGIGIDMVNIQRIEKILVQSEKKFLKKYFTKAEIKLSKKYKGKKYAAYFAKRFAAKEAMAKAFGTGFGKVELKEISVEKAKSGKPMIKLSGKAKTLAGKKSKIYLSLSDEYPFAVAMVIISSSKDR